MIMNKEWPITALVLYEEANPSPIALVESHLIPPSTVNCEIDVPPTDKPVLLEYQGWFDLTVRDENNDVVAVSFDNRPNVKRYGRHVLPPSTELRKYHLAPLHDESVRLSWLNRLRRWLWGRS